MFVLRCMIPASRPFCTKLSERFSMNIELDDKQVDFLLRALVFNHASLHKDFEDDQHGRGMEGLLIGKLVQANRKLHERFNELSDERWKKGESFTSYLFMGSGFHSLVETNRL